MSIIRPWKSQNLSEIRLLAAPSEASGVLAAEKAAKSMQPLFFEPVLKRARWGGVRLASLLGKPAGPETDYAESWEIADHGADQSRVSVGPLQGLTMEQLVRDHGRALFGAGAELTQFPLLIKYLDASDWLSLQVHPNDAQAKTFDPSENGKTEAWVIMEAAADSRICAGLLAGVSAQDLRQAIAAGTVEDCLHMLPVHAGDCVFVPAGTVHALGPGILLAEIQQQSNLTFRLHDWGRVGTDGKPRPLHLEESLACTDFDRGPVEPVSPRIVEEHGEAVEELVRCPWFVIRRRVAARPFVVPPDGRFRILLTVSGDGVLRSDGQEWRIVRGSTVLLPADRVDVRVLPRQSLTVIEVLPF